jgi:hypothetical protein
LAALAAQGHEVGGDTLDLVATALQAAVLGGYIAALFLHRVAVFFVVMATT